MNKKTTLILGDILAIAIVTVIGFISHDEFDFPYISRMGTTFFPLLLSVPMPTSSLTIKSSDQPLQ